ncbi:hypothetical protein K435DRAFT_775205 [Dendrothele bispora CBS 962.96]|uniref:Zn(2)-C6 fungal-type domain-containing protein n=1 Tax=Dendrothele bispora (strain CBS 962.96) TaxID=1314807 RepID=A0A4S8MKC3_DENBC|nr:hypothetical protein K435DRAFT_775205 [Dendrothele bispora CBS 962.96]
MSNDLYYSSENFHHVPVKTESSPSPDLLPASASLQPQYQLSLPSQFQSSHPPNQQPTQQSVFRFGVAANSSSFSPSMAYNRQWQTDAASSQDPRSSMAPTDKYEISLDNAMSFDEYDDVSELVEIGSGNTGSSRMLDAIGEKAIRRRSSKACDQCRKSKCKCERPSPNEPCRSCVMLGTACTFLGPSRKRGPPKGYIDAIEARLHQTEALLGIMLASSDERADTLLRDISQDPLAREIINRVDNSPYGVKGRNGGNESDRTGGKSRYAAAAANEARDGESTNADFTSTHPSNEWQDRVIVMLRSMNSSSQHVASDPEHSSGPVNRKLSANHSSVSQIAGRDALPTLVTSLSNGRNADRSLSPGRRQRRRVDESAEGFMDGPSPNERSGFQSLSAPVSTVTTPIVTAFSSHYPSSVSSATSSPGSRAPSFSGTKSSHPNPFSFNSASHDSFAGSTEITPTGRPVPGSLSDDESSLNDDEMLAALGQLSLNEEEQVRYHGKASGLYLLGSQDRLDHRNEGGIWRFPKARVWPPLPSTTRSMSEDEEITSLLPPPELQEHLLDIYFTYVHPSFPVVHKRLFFDALRSGPPTIYSDSPPMIPQAQTPESDSLSTTSSSSSSSPYNRRPRRVPALLLFAMFSIAARYSSDPSIPDKPQPSPTGPSQMWAAGDVYLEQAQKILDKVYANSRPCTCQALLLMGYREIGIGAMAQSWTYVGMAIRMAQDLGMHRSADRWVRAELGGKLFGDLELQERRRIWYSCVIMDKYVSAYIGRPLMIFERDFDTMLPGVEDLEETQEIQTDSTAMSVPGRIVSCFNAAVGLSGILSMIITAIYAVKPVSSRHEESVYFEGILDKWYHELPEHLRHQPSSSKHPVPLPHVLTLHLQYWCAVLLLHRPFIRNPSRANPKHRNTHESETSNIAEGKSYELCVGAANHITSIAWLYKERYSLERCPVFFSYYVFTAGIMHVTTLSTFPNDPRGLVGLQKCSDILKTMEVVWPSAGRALELLQGAKLDLESGILGATTSLNHGHKRPLERGAGIEQGHYQLQYPSNSPPLPPPVDNTPFRTYTVHGNPYPTVTPVHSPASSATSHYPAPTNYQRWPLQNQYGTVPFNAAVSTSSLSQSYSTGLVGDRIPAISHHGRPAAPTASNNDHHHNSSNDSQYPPEFWNNYSTYPRLENSYHATAISDHHNPVHPHHPSSTHVFNSEPYNLQ